VGLVTEKGREKNLNRRYRRDLTQGRGGKTSVGSVKEIGKVHPREKRRGEADGG